MGLAIGYSRSDEEFAWFEPEMDVHYSYGSHMNFRVALLNATYPDIAEAFANLVTGSKEAHEKVMTLPDTDPDLALFVLHCDCEGDFTPDECRKVADRLDQIELVEAEGDWRYEYLARWQKAFRFCADNKCYMIFC